jgi:hypothetical protein
MIKRQEAGSFLIFLLKISNIFKTMTIGFRAAVCARFSGGRLGEANGPSFSASRSFHYLYEQSFLRR